MPRLKNKPPKMQKTKKGDCFVSVGGKKQYLGKFGEKETVDKYAQFIAQWNAGDADAMFGKVDATCVVEIVSQYLEANENTLDYRVLHNIKTASRYLVDLYGLTPAEQFGPKSLAVVREQFVKAGYAREHCNKLTKLIRRIFRWAVSQELVLTDHKTTWQGHEHVIALGTR